MLLDENRDRDPPCLYRNRRLLSLEGYEVPPPSVDTSLVLPLPPCTPRSRRLLDFGGKLYYVTSLNSGQVPYYPGCDYPRSSSNVPLPQKRRVDGHVGPGDPTKNPLPFQRWEPWLPFIEKDPGSRDDPDDDPDVAYIDVFDVWKFDNPYTPWGKLTPAFIHFLKDAHDHADKQNALVKKDRAHYVRGQIINEGMYLTQDRDFEDLRRIRHFDDAIDAVPRLQRLLLEKRAYFSLVSNYPFNDRNFDAPDQTIATLKRLPIMQADERYVGLWLNGRVISDLDFLWFLTQAGVPCFVLEEAGPQRQEMKPWPSLVSGTDIEIIMAKKGYDDRAVRWNPEIFRKSAIQQSTPRVSEVASSGACLLEKENKKRTVHFTESVEPYSETWLKDDQNQGELLVKRPVDITVADYRRLMNPSGWLNDSLIEFGLRLYLQELEQVNPQLASRFFVFSTFFFKVLSDKGPREATEKFFKAKLRDKEFIIVPINDSLHWYLAIIYIPRPKPQSDHLSSHSVAEDFEFEVVGGVPILVHIWMLDSLAKKHPEAIDLLKKFLAWVSKEQMEQLPSKPLGSHLTVPKQPNFCDCGLYMLHNAHQFIFKSAHFVRLFTSNVSVADWEPDKLLEARQRFSKRIMVLAMQGKAALPTEGMAGAVGHEAFHGPEILASPSDAFDDEMEVASPAPDFMDNPPEPESPFTYGQRRNPVRIHDPAPALTSSMDDPPPVSTTASGGQCTKLSLEAAAPPPLASSMDIEQRQAPLTPAIEQSRELRLESEQPAMVHDERYWVTHEEDHPLSSVAIEQCREPMLEAEQPPPASPMDMEQRQAPLPPAAIEQSRELRLEAEQPAVVHDERNWVTHGEDPSPERPSVEAHCRSSLPTSVYTDDTFSGMGCEPNIIGLWMAADDETVEVTLPQEARTSATYQPYTFANAKPKPLKLDDDVQLPNRKRQRHAPPHKFPPESATTSAAHKVGWTTIRPPEQIGSDHRALGEHSMGCRPDTAGLWMADDGIPGPQTCTSTAAFTTETQTPAVSLLARLSVDDTVAESKYKPTLDVDEGASYTSSSGPTTVPLLSRIGPPVQLPVGVTPRKVVRRGRIGEGCRLRKKQRDAEKTRLRLNN